MSCRELPINAYTSGNHIWDKKDFVDNYDHYEHVIRPANYPQANPGKGRVIRQTAAGVNVAVLQVMGNVFMPPCDNPFYVVGPRAEGDRRRGESDHRRHPLRGHLGEAGHGTLSRRPRLRRRRHAHARADGRRAHPAERHRVPDRRRDDRRVRFGHRIPSRRSAAPLSDEHAEEAGSGQARHPPLRRDDRSRRDHRHARRASSAFTRRSRSSPCASA